MGRISERRLFVLGAECAREHALVAAGFVLDAKGGFEKTEDGSAKHVTDGEASLLQSLRWPADPSFPEVSAD